MGVGHWSISPFMVVRLAKWFLSVNGAILNKKGEEPHKYP
jgi:hypothetical protein